MEKGRGSTYMFGHSLPWATADQTLGLTWGQVSR